MASRFEPTSASGAAATATLRAGAYVYERRRPELGTLHRVVRENLQTQRIATNPFSSHRDVARELHADSMDRQTRGLAVPNRAIEAISGIVCGPQRWQLRRGRP